MKSLLRYFLARPTTTAAFATPIYTITRLRQFSKFRETATSRFYTSEAGNNAISPGADPAAPRTPTPKLPPPCPNELRNLPSQQESRRSDVSKRFSRAMDDLQTAVFTAGQKLNILTGYSDIESLKKAIEAQEKHVRESRLAVRQAKEDYQNAINRRSASQREVNELLQRKHAWSSTDLERFTQLYRSDHTNEQQEVAAQERLATAESTADEAQTQLARSILARYHEEQIWSDKIRRASTWGTWGLMGFNVLLFIVVQLGLEPWKRKRLVGGFEEKVREVIQEETRRNELLNVQASPRRSTVENIWGSPGVSAAPLESTTDISKDLLDTVAIEQWTYDDTNPELESEDIVNREGKFLAKQALLSHSEDIEHSIGSIKQKVMEFLSETEVTVTQKELTKIAAQSAALGVLLTALVSFFITKR